jgi:hypothetical protein
MRVLTEYEILRVEEWAHGTKLSEILSFFERLPREFYVPRAMLLGSNNQFEVLVEGLTPQSKVISTIGELDEPFNANLSLQRILRTKRREKKLGTLQSIFRERSRGFAKVCLAQGLGNCRGKIVRAHTLQRAAFEAHACKGHVYEFDPLNILVDDRAPTLIGINKATTFTGFCEYHDTKLFAPIEAEQFQSSPEQIFLHHYRAIAQAFYNRVYKAKLFERAYTENAQKVDGPYLRWLAERIRLTHVDAAELRKYKCRYEQFLLTKNWSAVEGYAWIGTHPPDIFATDFFAPRKDLKGRIIQDCNSWAPLEWLSLTVTATENRALVLLCAKKNSRVLAACANSLKQIPTHRQSLAIVNYVLCQLENFIMLPAWWESLEDNIQKQFINAYYSRYFPRNLPSVCNWGLSALKPV